MSHRKNYCKNVGVLSAICIKPCLTACLTEPVLNVTVLIAGRSLSLYVSCLSVSHRKNYCKNVGVLSASLVKPSLTACLAEPVLNVTVLIAGRSLSSYVSCRSVCHRKDYALKVGLLGKSLVCPSNTTVGAVPVLNVTVLVAGSSLSLYVYDGVSSVGIGLLVANGTDLVAGICILMARGLTNVLPAVVAVHRLGTGCGRAAVLDSKLGAALHTSGGITAGRVPVIVTLCLGGVLVDLVTYRAMCLVVTVFCTGNRNLFINYPIVGYPDVFYLGCTANGTGEKHGAVGLGGAIGLLSNYALVPRVRNVTYLCATYCTFSRVTTGGILGVRNMICIVSGGSTALSTSGESLTCCLGPLVSTSYESDGNNSFTTLIPGTKTNSIGLASLNYEGVRSICIARAAVFSGHTVNKLEVIEPIVALNCPSEGYRTVSSSSKYVVNHIHIVGNEGYGLGKSLPNEGILLGTIRLAGSRSFESNVNSKAV